MGNFFVRTPVRRVATGFVVCGLICGALLAGNWLFWRSLERPTRQHWAKVKVGDSEESVVAYLGAPHKTFSAKDAPSNYYVSGYRRRVRPITNRVLIYLGGELILYVWIDEAGLVEEKFVGRS